MGEHGVSWENMENMENAGNMENVEKYQPDDLKHSLYDSRHFFVTKKTLFVNHMTENTLFHGIYGDG